MEVPEGRLVLRLLRHLESSFYDKEMLARAAKESGICEEILRPMMRNQRTVFSILW